VRLKASEICIDGQFSDLIATIDEARMEAKAERKTNQNRKSMGSKPNRTIWPFMKRANRFN